jgi:GNAT superfamily N-acetyltransferase
VAKPRVLTDFISSLLYIQGVITLKSKMSTITHSLRKAKSDDLPRIVEITSLVVPLLNAQNNFQWNDTYPLLADFEKDISNDCLWVAEVDGTVAGYAALTTDQPEEYVEVGFDINEKCIVPHRIAVDPAFRGKSVALNFMLKAEELAKELGYPLLRVDTNVKNVAMQNMFEKLSYKCAGEISFKNKPVIYEKMMFKCYQKELKFI